MLLIPSLIKALMGIKLALSVGLGLRIAGWDELDGNDTIWNTTSGGLVSIRRWIRQFLFYCVCRCLSHNSN